MGQYVKQSQEEEVRAFVMLAYMVLANYTFLFLFDLVIKFINVFLKGEITSR